MSEPTAYDLTQDEKIAEHSELLQVSDVAPAGSQRSYPAVGQPMSDSMWAWITTGMGNGVISYGGAAYWLSDPNNVNNTFKLSVSRDTGTANAVLAGYFHELTGDIRINFPAVTKETLYRLCLTFDPLLSQSATGPVTLQVYPGVPPTSGGKRHLLLWTVKRKPNTAMTMNDRTKYRPRLAPTQYIDNDSMLPDVSTQMWGSTFITLSEGRIWIAHGRETEAERPSSWYDATHGGSQDTGWVKLDLIGNWLPSDAEARRVGNRVTLRKTLKRDAAMSNNTDANPFSTGFPPQFRPPNLSRFEVAGDIGGTPNWGLHATVYIDTAGGLRVINKSGSNLQIVSLDGITYLTD